MHRSGMQHFLLVGAVLAFCVLAVSACGAPEEAKPRPLSEETRELEPGTYRTEEFQPAFSFKVGEGWTHLLPEKPDDLALARGQTGLRFFKVREVFKPDERYEVVEAPNDLVGWLRRHPYLRTSAPEPVKVGGIEGQRFDVSVGDVPEHRLGGACGSGCVDQFRLGDGTSLGVAKGEKVSGTVLEDVGGDTVAIGFGGPADEFDEHKPEAQKVTDTVRWRGG
jgi:hypothetical protein